MKPRNKKKALTREKAAQSITDSIWAYLRKLPSHERKRRLDEAHISMKKKTAKVTTSSSASDTHHTQQEHDPDIQNPLAARSER